jgi:antitoxin component YwqK of YwqJK toxin-antitoxin module
LKNSSLIFILYFKKTVLSLLLIIAGMRTYAQTFERAENGPRKVKNERDAAGRRQGTWKYYYYTGDLRAEITYLNNLMEGPYKRYNLDEKIFEELNYHAGKKDGEYKKYFLSGQVATEGKYDMGIKDEKWIDYYEDGSIKREMEFKKGKREGQWKIYNTKGVALSTITYKDGIDVNAPPPKPPTAAKEKTGKIKKGK